MPFNVNRIGQKANQFRISIGDGRPITAFSLEEVDLALRHYYGLPRHAEQHNDCPFCRARTGA